MVVWDREDYLKEAHKQLEDREVYEEVLNDPNVLVNTIIKTLEKLLLRGDLQRDLVFILLFRIQNSLGFICYPKFISFYTMYLVDQ